MEPRKLLGLLMDRESLTANALAKKLQNKPGQPQISKYLNGTAREPKRDTLRPVAAYFGVNLEAFYDAELADQEAKRLGVRELTSEPAPPPAAEVPVFYRQVILDLEELGPTQRREFLEDIHKAAEYIRDARRHHERKERATSAAARKALGRDVATMTYGDGNINQGALPLATVADPFTASPSERESAFYRGLESAPKGTKRGRP